jgi:ATP-dependent RNA helicase DDX5/DBP2
MAELAKDTTVGHTNKTVTDNDVKVFDMTGQRMENPHSFKTFTEIPFQSTIQADLARAGFPAPSQIQSYCWPLALQEKDVIGVAATGSGKTLSFLLPAISWMLNRQVPAGDPSLLVMAPTRELAIQIEEEAVKFCRNSGIKTTCCYGGAPKPPQAQAIREGLHGIIGTPGRLNDFLEAGQLRLGRVAKLVLDEADRMLDMGFEPQIRKILSGVPQVRHTMFFTATWPKSVQRIAMEFIRAAYKVEIGNRDELKGNQDITQMVKKVDQYNKQNALMDILRQAGVADRNNMGAKGLVFCGTKKMCDNLSSQLGRIGVPSNAIHGDKGQREREQALNDLKEGRIKTLVATDVAARGLDIKGVTLVVNYDLPANTEDYVHRIGRTGRAGQKGYAVALVTDRDAHALKGVIEVMKRTNQEVTPDVQALADSAFGKGGGKGRWREDGDKGKGKGKGKGDDRGDSFGYSQSSDAGGGGMPPMGMPGSMPPMGDGGSREMRDQGRGREPRDRSRGGGRDRRRSPSRRRRSPSRRRSRSRKRRSPSRDKKRKRRRSSSSS